MEHVIYIVIGLIAFWLGWHLRGVVILAHLANKPEDMIKILEQIKKINQSENTDASPTGVELRIERVDNVLYAYRQNDNSFIAQGDNLSAVLETAHSRFPGVTFFGEIEANNPAKEIAQ